MPEDFAGGIVLTTQVIGAPESLILRRYMGPVSESSKRDECWASAYRVRGIYGHGGDVLTSWGLRFGFRPFGAGVGVVVVVGLLGRTLTRRVTDELREPLDRRLCDPGFRAGVPL